MPVMNGVEATRRIKIEFPGMIVIGLPVAEDMQGQGSLARSGRGRILAEAPAGGRRTVCF